MKKHKRMLSFLSLLIVFESMVFCQTNNSLRDSIYFKGEALFKCNIKLPNDYNPDKSYPMVIGLHGGGGTPESFIKVWDKVENVDFIYATPQGPYSFKISDLAYEWSLWTSPDLQLRKKAANLISDYIADLVISLKEKYMISDVFLFGFSQGAIFTYIAGLTHHELYKGIVVFSGAGIFKPLGAEQFDPDWLEEKYIEPAKSLKVFIAHGTKDQAAKFELGVNSYNILKSYGFDVKFESFEGGHVIDQKMLDKALNWINN